MANNISFQITDFYIYLLIIFILYIGRSKNYGKGKKVRKIESWRRKKRGWEMGNYR